MSTVMLEEEIMVKLWLK